MTETVAAGHRARLVPPLRRATSTPSPRRSARSFARYGFAVIADHGLDQARIDAAIADAKAFFALPDDGEAPLQDRGRGRPARLHAVRRRDRQGRGALRPQGVLARRPRAAARPSLPRRACRTTSGRPRSPASASDELWLYDALEALGDEVLRAIARYLGLPTPASSRRPRQLGNSVLRLLHYPPAPFDGPNVRAGAHEDINTITLLLGAEEAGLEVLDRDGALAADQPAGRQRGLQHRRHAAAADQPRAALDDPPGGQPAAGAPRRRALLDAVLPALRAGLPDRDAARLHHAGAARTATRRRSPPTTTSKSGWRRSS